MTDTFQRLSAFVMRDYKLPPDRVTPEAPLSSLGIDSLGAVELFWNIEEAFHIRIPPQVAELATLGDLARHVDQLVAAQASAPGPASSRRTPVRTT